MLSTLSKEEIEHVLKSNVVGRIGCTADNKVYVVPVTYGYDGESIIGHTVEGLKVDILRKNPECCFEVDVIESLGNWRSVIAWGTFEELQGDDAAKASEVLGNKISQLIGDDPAHPPRMGPSSSMRMHTFANNTIIYRIRITEKTGRYEKT